MRDAAASSGSMVELEQRVAFEAIRGRLFGEAAQPVAIGRFLVTRRLGQGGMGVVYAAYDPQLDRKVAVKMLRDVGDVAHAEKARRSLEREAKAAAGLAHPNVVTVYDSGIVEDGVYVAMELVEGSTLRTWLETRHRWPEIVQMFVAAGEGLWAAHEAGMVHCDFKPDNVLVGADGRPRVVDFGLVRSFGRPAAKEPTGLDAVPGLVTDAVLGGTPAYMPPEQLAGQAEARSDQYAFCVALYRALFGAHPYRTTEALGWAHVRTRVPRRVVRALVKGLAYDVEARHASMRALLSELQRALRWRAQQPWVLAGVAVVGLAAGVGSALGPKLEPCEGAAAEIEAIWTDDAKAAVTASLVAADPTKADALVQRLDAYATAWGEMQRESCEATHVRGMQSGELLELRTACLQRSGNTFAYAVGRLRGLSPEQGAAGRTLVAWLLPVTECTADALRSRAGGRGMGRSVSDRSRSPESNAAFLELAGLLDRARGEQLLGTRARALALAAQAEARAREVGLRYLEAEAIELRVALLLDEGGAAEVEGDLLRALGLAVEADDPTTAAQAVVRLLSLERLGGPTVENRPLLVALGRSLAVRSMLAPVLRAKLDFEVAAHAQAQGDHATALAIIGEARATLTEAGRAEDTIALELRTLEGRSLLELGRLEDAEHELGEVLALQRASLPAGADDLGVTTFYLASVLLARGKAAAALPLAEEALAIYRERRGMGDPAALMAWQVLARVLRKMGDRSRAAAELEAMIEQVVRSHGGFAAPAIAPLLELTELEHEAGELARARLHALLARAAAAEHLGAEHELTSLCGLSLAKVALDRGELALARTLLEEARLRVSEALDPCAPAEVAHQRARLALLSSPPEPAGALALSDEALAHLRDVPGDAALRLHREILQWRRTLPGAQAG